MEKIRSSYNGRLICQYNQTVLLPMTFSDLGGYIATTLKLSKSNTKQLTTQNLEI